MMTGLRRVLLVEDDADIRDIVALTLERDGLEVEVASDATTARRALDGPPFDLLILDLTLPDANGLDLLAEINERSDVFTIILSAHASEGDRILGLRSGADDYIVKPFSPRELSARVEAVLRRDRRSGAKYEVSYLDLHVDRIAREVTVGGELVDFTAKEFDLFVYLAEHPGAVVTRDEIGANVWRDESDPPEPATVTEFVRRVRQRLEVDPGHRRWIETVWGSGYRFNANPPSD